MGITLQAFNAIKQPMQMPNNYLLLSKQIHALIQRYFPNPHDVSELKQAADLTQFGLQEPGQVRFFLNNTPLGRILMTLIGKEEELQETLLEAKWQHNIEQAQMDDDFKQFILYKAAQAIKKAKEQVRLTNSASYQLPLTSSPLQTFKHEDTTLDLAIEKYELTYQRLNDSINYSNFLSKRSKALASIEIETHKILSSHDAITEITQAQSLLQQTHTPDLVIEKQSLIKKLAQKREHILSTLSDSSNHHALINAEQQLHEYLLVLHLPSDLDALEPQLENATTLNDFTAYLAQLQALSLITNAEKTEIKNTASKLFENLLTTKNAHNQEVSEYVSSDKKNAPNIKQLAAQKALDDFKASLTNQYGTRTLLNKQGEPLNNQTDLNAAYYTKPKHMSAHYINGALHFIDKDSLTSQFALTENNIPFLDRHKNPYLTSENARIEEENGELYLLKPGQELNSLSPKEKMDASRAADKAKQAAFSARALAEQYTLSTKRFAMANHDVEQGLVQCHENQTYLRLILKEKRKKIDTSHKRGFTPKDETAMMRNQDSIPRPAPTPNLSPRKILSLQEQLKSLENELNYDFKKRNAYDEKKMSQMSDRLIHNMRDLPPEAQSLIIEKYRAFMPTHSPYSHIGHPNQQIPPLNTAKPSQDIEIAKQQVELRTVLIQINKLLESQQAPHANIKPMPTYEPQAFAPKHIPAAG